DQRGFHRLSEIVKRTELHGLDAIVVVRLPGEDDNLAGQTRLAEAAQRAQSPETGHPEIEQHHVERLLTDPFQCRLSTRRTRYEVSGCSQPVLHHEAERLLVVDDEDPHGGMCRLARAGAHDSRGSSNSTVVPPPTPGLSARMIPPCCSMNDWQMARPSPTPRPISFVVKNGS